MKYQLKVFTNMHKAIRTLGTENLHHCPEKKLGPWEQIEFVLEDMTEWANNPTHKAFFAGIATTSDHIVNGVRLGVVRGLIPAEDVEITFYGDGMSGRHPIHVDPHGALDEYPDGFLDTWNNVLKELI